MLGAVLLQAVEDDELPAIRRSGWESYLRRGVNPGNERHCGVRDFSVM